MSDPQEPHFFSDDSNWSQGLDYYRSLFPRPEDGFMAVGEGTVYSESTDLSLERIRSVFQSGDLKLIYVARHPLERLESAYRHNYLAYGKALSPFPELILQKRWFFGSSHFKVCCEWKKAFGTDNLYPVLFEDLVSDPLAVARSCFEFLGLDPDVDLDFENRAYNNSGDRAARTKLTGLESSRFLRMAIPKAWRPKLRNLAVEFLGKRVQDPAIWSAESLSFACHELESDAHTFLKSLGRDPGLWAFPHRTI